MLERLERVENKIDGLETRFDRLETRFDKLEARFDVLETRFDKLETRFVRLDVQVEQLRDGMRMVTEGFSAGFDTIGRQLTEMRTDLNGKVSDHDLVLLDHSRRITALERPRSG